MLPSQTCVAVVQLWPDIRARGFAQATALHNEPEDELHEVVPGPQREVAAIQIRSDSLHSMSLLFSLSGHRTFSF